jgi:predicted secreted protein
VLIVVAGGLVGCGGSDSSSSTTTVGPVDGVVSDTVPSVPVFSDPAQPIVVNLGMQFAIVLDANPAAGESWQPVQRPDPAVILSIGSEFRAPGEAVVGQTQTTDDTESQVLRYGARQAGAAQITLRYGRAGSTPTPDDPTLTFAVTVVDPSIPTTTAPPATDPSTTTTSAPAVTTTTKKPRSTTTTKKPKSTTTSTGTPTTP